MIIALVFFVLEGAPSPHRARAYLEERKNSDQLRVKRTRDNKGNYIVVYE
jgi:hypothetical protein